MSNFNLRPIPKEIRYKLLQKQKAFARLSIEKPSSANEPIELGDDFLNFHNRATWAHMIGLTVITGDDNKQRIAIIGAGELNQEPGVSVDGVANEPLDLMKSSFDSIYSNTLYRPISGIKSISTRYEGTLKSRRECTVNFTVFSLEDLDRLSPYFFRVGSEVLVEFGWNVASDKDTSMFKTSLGHKIIQIYNEKGVKGFSNSSIIDLLKNNTAENYEKEILKHNGDYEYVLGQISMFEYSLRSDGGFDCVVKIQTVGMSLLDTKVNREYSPSAISAVSDAEERKREFTSPDEVSDEFYQMMHNLPEIIYGSLIQGYGDTLDKKPPDPDKDKNPPPTTTTPNNGINTIAAAWYLMGGMWHLFPSTHHLHKETQQFALIWLTWAAGLEEWKHWTTNKPLVSVYQEALMEQGHDLTAGPDGGMIRKDGSMSETQKAGNDFFNKFKKGGVEYPDSFINSNIENFSTGPDSGNKMMKKYLRPRHVADMDPWTKRMDTIRNDIWNKNTFKSNDTVTDGAIKFLSIGTSATDPRRKKFNNVSPKYLISQEVSVSNVEDVEELDIPQSIESKFYIPLASGKSITEVDSGASGASTSFQSVKNMTIFTTYKQKDIIQIFTGFNWGKSKKDFDKLSQKYALETYRDNLIPIGKARAEAKVASETYGFAILNEKAAKDAGWDIYGRIVNDIMSKFGIHPAYQSMAEDKDNPYLSTADAAAGLGADASDEFLEFVDPSGKVPPKIWIRWGWFEDNILTRYLGYMTDVDAGGSPVSLFKSVEPKINLKGEIIPGYESNKIGLPGPLLTTNVNQIIIPDRIETLENTKIDENSGELHNFYASLGMFLNGEVGTSIPKVEIAAQSRNETSQPEPGKDGQTEEYKVGYIRNLYVEAYTLQEAFLNIGTLKEGLDRFISIMSNNFGKIHQLEVQQGRDDNMVGIVDTNLIYDNAIWKEKRKEETSDSLKTEADKINVFEFPAWEKESIVKSQDLKVTIPNEMALTALYSANEHMRNFGIYDESRGSLEAQKLSKFLRLNDKGKDIAEESVSNGNTQISPIITSKNLTISGDGENEVGKHKYNYKDSFLPLLNAELLRSMGKNPINATPIKLREKDVNRRKSQNTAHNIDIAHMKRKSREYGYYTNKGTLEENNPYNMRRIMEYELQYTEKGAVQNNYPTINGLLDLSLTIDGTAGIFPGNSYISKYLPKAWQARTTGKGRGEYPVLFQATDVAHEISSDGWSTTLTGMPRMNPKAFPYKYAKREDNDKNQEAFTPRLASTPISEYYNFFNLNYNFASKCLIGDSAILEGINTTFWPSDDNKPGSLEELGGNLVNAITRLRKPDSALRDGKYEQGDISEYADFSEVFKSLEASNAFEESIIPSKKVQRTVPKKFARRKYTAIADDDDFFIIYESDFISNVELLLFLQMSMIISGLASTKIGIDKAFYNKMLADTNFKSFRPNLLRKVGDDNLSRLISKSEIDVDDVKKIASEVYFSTVELNDDGKFDQMRGLLPKGSPFYWYTVPISDYFMWTKLKYHFEGNDVPTGRRLIGPARFSPPVSLTQSQPPYNEDLKLLENVFMTILRNEYGIGSWSKFDTLIAKSLGPDQLLISSQGVFEYALDCEYRIKNPS
jgi:hypothetical protein